MNSSGIVSLSVEVADENDEESQDDISAALPHEGSKDDKIKNRKLEVKVPQTEMEQ